jgi:phenylacetate-coenzyme A ligase PaaK-like adenylate-forming protein
MGIHPVLVNRVMFPLHERLKGKPTHARLRELDRSQWLAPEQVRAHQFRALKAHLEFAYRHVPYYRRLLDDHGLPPGRIASFEDFAQVPCLTKDGIRANFDDLRPDLRLRGVQRMSTGGSTGATVTVLVDAERSAFTDAARLRAHRWFDADMGTPEIVLWGSPIELGRQDHIRSIRDWFLNSTLLSAFDLGEAALARYAQIIRRYRPGKLYGYASALSLLASYMAQRGWTTDGSWPRVVFTTAEPLYDFQRRAIQSVFRCPVSVEYGCRDGGLIATECPAGGLHIPAEGMVVETLPDGEIVVTNLAAMAMPIIRYRTGDIGALDDGPCSCGRGLPLLKRVEGRRTDFLVTPAGKVMHALAAIYVLREVPEVREFQIVQERVDHLVIRIVAEGSLSARAQSTVRERMTRLFDAPIAIDLEIVEQLTSPSGKHRHVISRVAETVTPTPVSAG